MPQPKKTLPRYLKRSDGRGRIVWTDSAGRRQEKVLPGAYNSPESLEAFARLQLELAVRLAAPVLRVTDAGPTVNEVLAPTSNTPGSTTGRGRTWRRSRWWRS